RQALAIRLKALGEGHPHTAQSYGNLAANLNAQGKYAQAEPLHRKALAIRLKALGEGHPETALSYNNLAAPLHRQEKYAQAALPPIARRRQSGSRGWGRATRCPPMATPTSRPTWLRRGSSPSPTPSTARR